MGFRISSFHGDYGSFRTPVRSKSHTWLPRGALTSRLLRMPARRLRQLRFVRFSRPGANVSVRAAARCDATQPDTSALGARIVMVKAARGRSTVRKMLACVDRIGPLPHGRYP
ncbi:hypothetical protein LGM85_10975 [Burkholderia multivorans]|uniref:hypothetical protein n=1 Tax=Burkholderia multivorans TaxID=87883 RepID=UPI00018E30F5|nr:hypothetical protein [Burkholderia multivorans]EED99791.1 conserved hypothetical protein [Burkholderia multivorans CGD1]MBU9595189.1 hypothetical protein [Burkholderia multivorans]MBU9648533.1 hypothetical protein [Burkholderia multivorans]MCA8484463.1 hypothetical protein [Burkholderia multivorans]HEM7809459.1 hypothetical protein [Burkholderia multivorans]